MLFKNKPINRLINARVAMAGMSYWLNIFTT
jgi:hypothetical protein